MYLYDFSSRIDTNEENPGKLSILITRLGRVFLGSVGIPGDHQQFNNEEVMVNPMDEETKTHPRIRNLIQEGTLSTT